MGENKSVLSGSDETHIDAAVNSMAEIASCSYEARQAGIKNGMLFGRARKLCPLLQPIPYDFDAYRSVSQILYNTVASYTHDIEAVSCDEMFVDCVDLLADTGASPLQFATLVRQEIYDKTGCTASIGFGENMLQARMATRVAKPNGQFWLEPEQVAEFMMDKKACDLPGVGYSMSSKLSSLGVLTCGDLQKLSLSTLQINFGPKTGQTLYDHCRGKDNRSFRTGAERKSVSAEMNYGIRFSTTVEIDNFLGELAAEVQGRLARLNKKCKVVTLKIKVRQADAPKETAKFMGCGICDNISKSASLALSTDNIDVIAGECRTLVRSMNFDPSDLRGVGIQLAGLEPVKRGSGSAAVPSAAAGCRSILDFALPVAGKAVALTSARSTTTPSSVSNVGTTLVSVGQQSSVSAESSTSMEKAVRQQLVEQQQPCQIDNLPPLPTLYYCDSDKTKKMGNTTVNTECNWYLPTLSQIDLEVLRALPADIQANIESALQTKTHTGSDRPQFVAKSSDRRDIIVGNEDGGDSERPGCSHWTADMQIASDTAENHLPTFSQLDASFMAALPDDIRDEIRREYTVGRDEGLQANAMPATQLHPLMRPECIASAERSPKKGSPSKTSPKKGSPKKGSSPFKVPIGHAPPRRKYTKRKKLVDKQKQLNAVLPNASDTATLSTTSHSHMVDLASMAGQPPRAQSDVEQSQDAINKESLTDVRSMLRKWMTTCSNPSSEDLEAFVSYLVQLIHECDLERVSILLKFMQRLTGRECLSADWRNGGRWIIDQTQAVVKSTYGGTIKL